MHASCTQRRCGSSKTCTCTTCFAPTKRPCRGVWKRASRSWTSTGLNLRTPWTRRQSCPPLTLKASALKSTCCAQHLITKYVLCYLLRLALMPPALHIYFTSLLIIFYLSCKFENWFRKLLGCLKTFCGGKRSSSVTVWATAGSTDSRHKRLAR